MSFPTLIAAALSGATPRQLSYWRRDDDSGEPLLAPEFGKLRGQWRYSFRDVVALRTFVYLRHKQSLQRIRRAVETLRDFGNTEHLSGYRLMDLGDSIGWQDPMGNVIELVGHPGATRIEIVLMNDVFRPFRTQQGRVVVDLHHPRPNLEVDPETRGGYPVIAGTRIEFDLVADLVQDGVPPDRVSEIYPAVSADAARDAVEFMHAVEGIKGAARAS